MRWLERFHGKISEPRREQKNIGRVRFLEMTGLIGSGGDAAEGQLRSESSRGCEVRLAGSVRRIFEGFLSGRERDFLTACTLTPRHRSPGVATSSTC